MSGFVNLLGSLAVLWVALIGGAFVIQRRDWAAAVFAWPFTTSFRIVRRTIGGLLIAIGQAIRGGGPGGGHRDRRRGR